MEIRPRAGWCSTNAVDARSRLPGESLTLAPGMYSLSLLAVNLVLPHEPGWPGGHRGH